jgi:hypothetical protein
MIVALGPFYQTKRTKYFSFPPLRWHVIFTKPTFYVLNTELLHAYLLTALFFQYILKISYG